MKSEEHERRAQLRLETQTVNEYLTALHSGHTFNLDKIEQQIERLDERIEAHMQEGKFDKAMVLMESRNDAIAARDGADLEKRFIKVAASFGERKGVSYTTWREVGVPAQVLSEAGISR